jgi:3-dehydroquinate synthase
MDTRIVTNDLDARSYDIYIGAGLLFRIADFIPHELEGREVFIVTDKSVGNFATTIRDGIAAAGAARVEIFPLAAGEQAKAFDHVEALSHWLLQNGVSRGSLLLAVGGGVIGDLTGFCASIILRGIPYIQVPTTLLAQVDSSVGGKTGINTKFGKNLIGSFYQPAVVIADTDTLATLPRRELLAGYAEIAKYGLINDSGFFNWLENNGENVCALNKEAITQAIESSVKAKVTIVQADEKEETGQRALLNFGHTFGHALETAAGYDGRLLHGEAVAIGMCMAFDLSVRLGLCSAEDRDRAERHLTKIGLPTRAAFIDPPLGAGPKELLEIMKRDKKAVGGKMRFVVTSGIGQAFLSDDVPEQTVLEVLKDSLGAPATQGGRGRWKSVFSSR